MFDLVWCFVFQVGFNCLGLLGSLCVFCGVDGFLVIGLLGVNFCVCFWFDFVCVFFWGEVSDCFLDF